MRLKELYVDDCFHFIRNGISVKQNSDKGGLPITRIETISKTVIDPEKVGYADINENNLGKYENYLLIKGDILMSHINSMKYLGKSAIYENNPKKIIHGMNLLCLRPKSEICSPNYLNYFFSCGYFKNQLPKISNQSVNQASFPAGKLKKLKILLPPLKTQKQIAAILDDAASLRDKTQELLKEYNLLAQSIFLEMFGDPTTNSSKIETSSLSSYGSFKNGLNYRNNERGHEVQYLGVGDFKSKYTISDIDMLSAVKLNKLPSSDYFLKDGDLVFVRSNGNKKLVGRCLSIYPGEKKVTFSGFCIRYRLKSDLLTSTFIVHLFRNKSFKKYMLGNLRGANIQNINQRILSDLKILVPQIELQNQFAEKIALIEKQKDLAKQELKESEDLFNCLLQKAFKGELV